MTSDMRPESETLFNMIKEKYGDILPENPEDYLDTQE